MTNFIAKISEHKAAIVVGIGMIINFFLAIFVGEFILSNFIAPYDTAKLASDIKANEILFHIAVVGYLIILAIDSVIALALYIILKPANKNLALLSAVLRLMYTTIMIFDVLSLVFQFIDVCSYVTIELWIGYTSFTSHLFVTGYSVFKSDFIPKSLGGLLIIASFCYIPLFYVSFLVPEALLLIILVPAVIGEISLGIWLLLKANKIPERKP